MALSSPINRRTLFALGASVSAAALLSSCSTNPQTGQAEAGEAALKLWIWPEGFGDKVLANVEKEFPAIHTQQIIQGGDFKQKLQTALQAGSNLPNITGIKGEDIAYFTSLGDYFVDLNTLGAEKYKDKYVSWKWKEATTEDGKQLGIPIDIGPTALFYRFDIFERLGLTSDPQKLSAQIRQWDAFITLGKKMLEASPDTYLVRNLPAVFEIAWKQSGQGFISPEGKFIGEQPHIHDAWATAISVHEAGINAALTPNTPDVAAKVAEGKLPADFGASWHLIDLKVDAPDTKGKWHVCHHPGKPTNNGGSFLGIPAKATKHDEAFKVITEILNAENLALEYAHSGNFPANTKAFDLPEITAPVEFLGGQVASKVFSEAAKNILPLYEHPLSSTLRDPFYAELTLVEAENKDPHKAWDDALKRAKKLARQNEIVVA